MGLIARPPNRKKFWENPETMRSIADKLEDPKFQELIRNANDKYRHWDQFRYVAINSGFPPVEAWVYLKMVRGTHVKKVPFSDKNGNPFYYWIPDSMLKALNQIDLCSGRTIVSDQPTPLPSKEQYIISSLMEEAIASSQLEGAATTRQVAKELLRSGRPPRDKNEKMIVNNWRAIQYIRENHNNKITMERIFELHEIVTKDTLKDPSEVGTLRKNDEITVTYNGKVVHVPPSHETLEKHMEAFCDFANNDVDPWIHPVIKGAMLHFYFAYIHPFVDGNGRTARALLYWYMQSREYLLFEYLAISRYFLRAPSKYACAYLYTETDENDLTYFIVYNLRAILLAFRELQGYLARKQAEISQSNELLRTYRGLNAREKNLVYHAIRHPHATYLIEMHKNYNGIVYETARQDLMRLVKKGFLKKEKQGREYIFVPVARMIEKLKSKKA